MHAHTPKQPAQVVLCVCSSASKQARTIFSCRQQQQQHLLCDGANGHFESGPWCVQCSHGGACTGARRHLSRGANWPRDPCASARAPTCQEDDGRADGVPSINRRLPARVRRPHAKQQMRDKNAMRSLSCKSSRLCTKSVHVYLSRAANHRRLCVTQTAILSASSGVCV